MRIFLVTFFLIYGVIHLYAFLKARSALLLGACSSLCIAAFMVTMVFAPVIVRYLEMYEIEFLARVTSYTGFLWMGILFLFISINVCIDMYRVLIYLAGMLLKSDVSGLFPPARITFFISILISLCISAYGYFEARDISSESVTLKTSKISEAAGSLKIVQISDVHLGLIVRQRRLSRIIEVVKNLNPDILVSTGDLVDGQINKMEGFAEMFQQINPKYGKYAVTGNHEYYAGLDQALSFTERAGFTLIRGKSVDIAGLINLAGVDDSTGKQYRRDTNISEKELLSSLDRSKFTLLLKHRPVVERESQGLFDLQLSGHTHKGQIFPFSVLTKLLFPYISGYVTLQNGSSLYVSRGSGTWGPPIRFLSPPEVTLIELIHAEHES